MLPSGHSPLVHIQVSGSLPDQLRGQSACLSWSLSLPFPRSPALCRSFVGYAPLELLAARSCPAFRSRCRCFSCRWQSVSPLLPAQHCQTLLPPPCKAPPGRSPMTAGVLDGDLDGDHDAVRRRQQQQWHRSRALTLTLAQQQQGSHLPP